jgi:two-component system chemotaxis response regulator CheY
MARTLLITDDAIIIRAMIRDAAEDAGWEVVGEAANGQEAIDQYESLRPDGVTLDLVMPEYDGIHALKGIMAFDPDAKIVVVSALNQKETVREAFAAGASDFVEKPFDKDNLVQTLDVMVSESTSAEA